MLYTLESLLRTAQSVSVQINNRWVPCRGEPPSFLWRVCAAWKVLIGKADAVMWPEGQ